MTTIINNRTKCKDTRKDCDIRPSEQPSLKAMDTVICHNHTEVISFKEAENRKTVASETDKCTTCLCYKCVCVATGR